MGPSFLRSIFFTAILSTLSVPSISLQAQTNSLSWVAGVSETGYTYNDWVDYPAVNFFTAWKGRYTRMNYQIGADLNHAIRACLKINCFKNKGNRCVILS